MSTLRHLLFSACANFLFKTLISHYWRMSLYHCCWLFSKCLARPFSLMCLIGTFALHSLWASLASSLWTSLSQGHAAWLVFVQLISVSIEPQWSQSFLWFFRSLFTLATLQVDSVAHHRYFRFLWQRRRYEKGLGGLEQEFYCRLQFQLALW